MSSAKSVEVTNEPKRSIWEPLPARVRAPEMPALEAAQPVLRIDTPLVFICPVKSFVVYWVPEVSSVLVRATAGAQVAQISGALKAAAQVVADFDAAALILDLSEAAPLAKIDPRAVFSGKLGLACMTLVTGAGEGPFPGMRRASDTRRYATPAQAFDALRMQGVASDPTETIQESLSAEGAELIVGTYAGCAYWLRGSKTVALVWSGDETDVEGMDFVYEAVANYTQLLRIEHVIFDVRNQFLAVENYNRACLQVFIDSCVFRGVGHFALVGQPGTLAPQNDSINEYLDALMGLVQVDLVKSFEGALALCEVSPE